MQHIEPLKGDEFTTLATAGETYFKEKGSKFYGFAFYCSNIEEVNDKLDFLKTKFKDAGHFCYAYRLNPIKPKVRANDDGEPNNSAGIPILNQLFAYQVWNVLVVVVRYFGGTKLGVGGLVSAYKKAGNEALQNALLKTDYIMEVFEIEYPYKCTAEVMRILNENDIHVIQEKMGVLAGYRLSVRKSLKLSIFEQLSTINSLKLNSYEP